MVGLFWLKHYFGTYLGISILCSTQFRMRHNRFGISSSANYSSSIFNIQGFVDYGNSIDSVSNLDFYCSQSGMGLLNEKLKALAMPTCE